MEITQAFAADIVKAERDSAGDLIVFGKASGPDVDLDAQICDPAWLKTAMPAWAEWGNLREMHQPIAAGVGMELEQQGDNWFVKSKVVDEGTAKKIEAGALKGYSVGIKNARVVKDGAAPGGRIVGGDIVEVSYVDRPCNPTATLAIAKAARTELAPVDAPDDEGQEQAAKTVTLTVGGTVWDEQELLKAVRAYTVRTSGDARDKAVALITKAIGPGGEVDETADIEGGKAAIALIAQLIKSEADELAAGHLDETCDISLLVRACDLLKYFLAREQAGETGASEEIAYVGLAAKLGMTEDEARALPDETKAVLADLAKRDFSADERDEAADKGQAEPDGSFPIKTKADLKNAISAVGRAKDPAKAKAHIKAQAKKLDAEDMIPDSWKTTEPEITKTTEADTVSKGEVADLVKSAVTEATKAAQGRIDALAAELAKVKATPIPGGPVVTAVRPRQADASPDLDKAAQYERMADQVTDPKAAAGYRQLAADLRRPHAGQ